ncbi:hypothetical protein PQ465_15680 [Sphingobacterium oryzagri]|uniref:Uncharacterized protein n=1 Tax=Sphingobacterium oryzagri TaxID=3025669 RepID=A0ABY7WH79_9SPHI|nr:hypothetical protein [Sphingobacterium sp. KACC 22765]WDF67738.1 hypothetical protein PQ465_15680 [Sphingobacterium sp. KACC 22765]
MAYTKESIFSKVGELLVELNDGYTELSEKELGEAAAELILLEAKAKFLTTHIEVLRQLAVASIAVSKPTDTSANTGVAEEKKDAIYFTAPIVLNDDADAQPTSEEIEELDRSKAANTSSAEQKQPADAPAEKPKEEPAQLSTPEPVEKMEEKAPQTLFTPQTKPAPQDSPAEEAEPAKEEPAAPKPAEQPKESAELEEKAPAEVVINEVIEEPKEIIIETPQPKVEEAKPARPLTLNEMLQQQRKAGFANSAPAASAKQSGEKIVDLKSVISLNDKLLFIKDLFNGYSLAYSEAVELLNRYSTFAEADVFLQTNYALKNNWGDKPQTVEKLYAVLRKKFMH